MNVDDDRSVGIIGETIPPTGNLTNAVKKTSPISSVKASHIREWHIGQKPGGTHSIYSTTKSGLSEGTAATIGKRQTKHKLETISESRSSHGSH